MCLTLPAKTIQIKGTEAIVKDCFDTEKKVNVSPISNLKVGDYVLIHADLALQKIDKQEADELKELLNE